MTREMIQEETGLPDNVLRSVMRSVMRRVPRVIGIRRVAVKRVDVWRVLRDDPPRGVLGEWP